MSILTSELIFFWSANAPIDDSGTSGGAIDTASRPDFTQFTANAQPAVVSDGADTRNVTIKGRKADGTIFTETNALNGTTEVVFSNTAERILSVTLASSSGTRTVSVKQGSGGTVRATLGVNITKMQMLFYDSASGTGILIRYEKLFGKNTNGSLALLNAQFKLTADPASRIRIGTTASVNDSTSVSNRLSVPGGVTFVDDNVAQNIPGTDLNFGAACGVWIEQNLPANDPANRNTFTLQLAGSTV